MAVYLLHSTVALQRYNGTLVRHYLGCTAKDRIDERLLEHTNGRSRVPIVKAFLEKGGVLQLGNLWTEEGYDFEQRLKRAGHLARHCYACRIDSLIDAWVEALR